MTIALFIMWCLAAQEVLFFIHFWAHTCLRNNLCLQQYTNYEKYSVYFSIYLVVVLWSKLLRSCHLEKFGTKIKKIKWRTLSSKRKYSWSLFLAVFRSGVRFKCGLMNRLNRLSEVSIHTSLFMSTILIQWICRRDWFHQSKSGFELSVQKTHHIMKLMLVLV